MLKVKNRLGLVFFPAFDWAISPTHPEREERLLYTMDQIHEEGIFDIPGIELYNPLVATEEDIARVHFCYPDIKTRVPQSHLISAGGAIKAAETVLNKEVDKAFAIVRPPGHHAHKVVYGDKGFCIINIEAIMVENIRAQFGHRKIAIIDTDCHHGDGTEDIFWNDPDTLFISFHQDGRTLYPGTGSIEEMGGPGGFGYNVNIPLPPTTGEEGFLHVLDHVVLPILEDFKPDLIINSAGQDNHYTDPITNMNFTAQGYALLNEKLNPDLAVLEGGYSIEGALPYVNLGIILAMAGLDYSGVREPDYNPAKLKQSSELTNYIHQVCDTVYANWQRREEIAHSLFKDKKIVKRQKRIYYDTSSIMEHQEEKITVCSKCSGLIVYESNTDYTQKLLGITIPRDSCSQCLEQGYDLYNKTKTNKSSRAYLQDKAHEKYYAK